MRSFWLKNGVSTIFLSKVRFLTISTKFERRRRPKKNLLNEVERVTFFGDYMNPLQYSGVEVTSQMSHKGPNGEISAYAA